MFCKVVDQSERRNITAGQKAIGHAINFPDPPSAEERGAKGGRGRKGAALSAGALGFSATLLKQARKVVNAPQIPQIAEFI